MNQTAHSYENERFRWWAKDEILGIEPIPQKNSFSEKVVTPSLCETTTVSPLSSDAPPTWNMQGQAFRQAAQGLSFSVHRSSREYKQ